MDGAFPDQHTTTTSTTVRTKVVNSTIKFNVSYIRTLPGLLKGLQLVLNLFGFLCVIVTVYHVFTTSRCFIVIAMTGFSFSALLLFLYFFQIVEKYHQIPWIKIEFVCCLILTMSNLISASFMTELAKYSAYLGAAAFFGFSAMVAYGEDAWLKFLAIKKRDIAQR